MKSLIYTSIFILASSFVFQNEGVDDRGKEYKTKHHIIIVVDGPRWSETWGDETHQYIPNQANFLKKEGTFFTNFRNNGPTYTNSGHTAICTGVYQRISNVGKQLPKNPSIFQYFLKQKKADKRDAWILTSKGKLEILSNTKNKKWWNKYMPSTYCGIDGTGVGYPDDKMTITNFKKILLENKPKLALINLLNIDAWAHQGKWDRYIGSIKDLDEIVLDLWRTIQSDPELKDQTAIYITNDHGRHLEGVKKGFESHGDNCEGCRHISLLALGPDFEKNKEVSTNYGLIDISATIAYMMHIDMPTGKGKPIKELIEGVK
ncbi:MAG: sulfatase [Crocinitomicaceae bacterium]|nr:sulfatase [Crocinitomicaceae bacterium]